VSINGIKIARGDIRAGAAYIHELESALLPPDLAELMGAAGSDAADPFADLMTGNAPATDAGSRVAGEGAGTKPAGPGAKAAAPAVAAVRAPPKEEAEVKIARDAAAARAPVDLGAPRNGASGRSVAAAATAAVPVLLIAALAM
jgi:hypothetical protein